MPYGWEPRALDYAPLRGIAHLQEWYDRLLKDLSTSVENCLPQRITQFWNDHRNLITCSAVAAVFCYRYSTRSEELLNFTGATLTALFVGRVISNISVYQGNRKFVQALMNKDFELARSLFYYIGPNIYHTGRRWDTLMHTTLRLTYQEQNSAEEIKRYKEIF
jgi:hypothetical protein